MLASNVTSHIFTEDKWQFVALVKFMDFHKLQHRHSSCWLSNDELLTTQHTVCVLTNLVSSVVLRWIYGCAESSILEDTQQTNTHRPNWRVSICRKPVPHNCIMLHVQYSLFQALLESIDLDLCSLNIICDLTRWQKKKNDLPSIRFSISLFLALSVYLCRTHSLSVPHTEFDAFCLSWQLGLGDGERRTNG